MSRTDPALVLRELRRRFDGLENDIRPVLAPAFETVEPARGGAAGVDDLSTGRRDAGRKHT